MTVRAFTSAFAAIIALAAAAQQPAPIIAEIEAGGTIKINQPAALDSLLSHRQEAPSPTSDHGSASNTPTEAATKHSRSGYRVQIFEDNNPGTARRQAEAYNARMHAEFPHIRTYISFNSPYWRVKAGDYRTKAEAEAMMADLKHAFPNLAAYMRIVRDKINTSD